MEKLEITKKTTKIELLEYIAKLEELLEGFENKKVEIKKSKIKNN